MFHDSSSAIFLTLALTAAAAAAAAKPIIQIREPNPTIDLNFAVRLNLSGVSLVAHDRARAAAMIFSTNTSDARKLRARAPAIDATNTGVTYVASVGVGAPATTYSLVVDTGSANTWVGSGKAYARTSSSVDLGKNISVTYGSGYFEGKEYNDTVTLSPDLVITQQSIGEAIKSSGFGACDGILGLGPVDLTNKTLEGRETVPTVLNNLFTQNKISKEVVSISFAPTTKQPNMNGVLTIGDTDATKFKGSLVYTPITRTAPANRYWGIDQSIVYGAHRTNVLRATSGIVDTGSTLLLLATDAFDVYRNTTGAVLDKATGLLKISNEDYAKLESLYFSIGGRTFEMTKNAQTFPRALNSYVGGDNNSIYLVAGDLGTDLGSGIDFINGYAFLERFYSVYDTTNQRVGIATTENTYSELN
ncbi:hypothetical protein EW145_g6173 [Phellinidium pouzarii]|uniref:Peptidase A1 domain-containing protein n=1 Tax=Phellinidium pouzarii TaxID=167371 RepID=A0A4S4KYM0_9AGAM|nr:hypothetical protein EW145_g6173 [Phellinidium pouzarii]